MFKVNDRVITKDNFIVTEYQPGAIPLKKGFIGTVRTVGFSGNFRALRLEEVINPPDFSGVEYQYDQNGFEKLVSDSELNEYRKITSIPELSSFEPLRLPERELQEC